jgi:hypothetical protein
MLRPVSALYFGTGPGRGLSLNPARPSRANRPRHRLTVRGMVWAAWCGLPGQSTVSIVLPPPAK